MERWDDVSSISTDGERIVDTQSGEVFIVRKFDFSVRPGLAVKPKKSDILTKDYIKHLEIQLWGDAMELVPPSTALPNPRVVIQKRSFTVFAVCKPKKGNIIPWQALAMADKPLHERLVEKDNG